MSGFWAHSRLTVLFYLLTDADNSSDVMIGFFSKVRTTITLVLKQFPQRVTGENFI